MELRRRGLRSSSAPGRWMPPAGRSGRCRHEARRARLSRARSRPAMAGLDRARPVARHRRHALHALPPYARAAGAAPGERQADQPGAAPASQHVEGTDGRGGEERRVGGAGARPALGLAGPGDRAGVDPPGGAAAASARRREAHRQAHRRGALARSDVRLHAAPRRRERARRRAHREPPGAARGSAASDPVLRAGIIPEPAMRWRLQLLLRRLGTSGVVGIGVLVACAGFWGSALAPAEQELAAQRLALERLHALARRSGLELAQGEYRLERPAYGLWAYRVTLPVRGGYGQVRAFIASLLRDIPTASLEGLRFERRKAAETELDAQLRITLHVRPTETP